MGRLTDAVVEFLQDSGAVGLVVPLPVALFVPLRGRGIIEQQWLTMAGGNHDAPLVGHLLTLRMTVESTCTGVHGWGEHIAFQTENQFTDTVVCLRAYVTQLLLISLRCPRLQAPVLVVDEDAAIFDGGRLTDVVLRIVEDTLITFIDGNIGKPVPRTDTYRLTDVKHAVSQTSGIRAGDVEIAILRINGITLPRTFEFAVTASKSCRSKGDSGAHSLAGANLRPCTRHPLDVIGQHLCHVFHQWRITIIV